MSYVFTNQDRIANALERIADCLEGTDDSQAATETVQRMIFKITAIYDNWMAQSVQTANKAEVGMIKIGDILHGRDNAP